MHSETMSTHGGYPPPKERGFCHKFARREGKRHLYEFGTLCAIVAFVLLFISFSSGYWIVSWPRVYSGFKRMGLWEVCFAGFVLATDPTQKAYHGCWWILAPEFRNIDAWLMPSWFKFTQVSVTFCFCAEIITIFLLLLMWGSTGAFQLNEKDKGKKRESIALLQTTLGILVGTAVVMTTTVVMFASMFVEDRDWLPNPYFNYLSWSYGLALTSTFFSIFASLALGIYVLMIRQEKREPPREAAMHGYPHAMLNPHDKSKDTTFMG